MVKFDEAAARFLRNMFVCKACKTKLRTSNMRVLAGKARCRKCDGTAFRPVRKK